jgi:hypothetical protein
MYKVIDIQLILFLQIMAPPEDVLSYRSKHAVGNEKNINRNN